MESKEVDLALFTDSRPSEHTLRFSFFRSEVDTPTILFAVRVCPLHHVIVNDALGGDGGVT